MVHTKETQMKTSIYSVALILFLVNTADAQLFNSSHVPEAAKVSFHQQYPKAKHIIWTKDDQGYQAQFDLHHRTFYVLYDAGGNSIAEIIQISKDKLPRRAKKQLRNNYTSYAIENTIKIISNDGKVTYGTHIGGVEEGFDLVFNSSGFIVSVVPEAADGSEE